MCGIIAVLRRPSRRTAPSAESLRDLLAAAERAFAGDHGHDRLAAAAAALSHLDRELKGVPGLWTLLCSVPLARELEQRTRVLQDGLLAFERSLDTHVVADDPDPALELRNQALVRLKDALHRPQRVLQ